MKNCYIVAARPDSPDKFKLLLENLRLLRENTKCPIILSLNYYPYGIENWKEELYDYIVYSDINEVNETQMAGPDSYQRILERIMTEMEGELGRDLTDEEYEKAGDIAMKIWTFSAKAPKAPTAPQGIQMAAQGGRIGFNSGSRPSFEQWVKMQGADINTLRGNEYVVMLRNYEKEYPSKAQGGRIGYRM